MVANKNARATVFWDVAVSLASAIGLASQPTAALVPESK
jgi:hypothetical protein